MTLRSGIAAHYFASAALATSSYASPLKDVYRLRVEVGSSRYTLSSLQRALHTFDFCNGLLRTESGDDLITEADAFLLSE